MFRFASSLLGAQLISWNQKPVGLACIRDPACREQLDADWRFHIGARSPVHFKDSEWISARFFEELGRSKAMNLGRWSTTSQDLSLSLPDEGSEERNWL